MTFEASITLSAGRGVLARLDADRNRWALEPCGSVSQAEVDGVAPRLFQQLSDRAQLPIRAMGTVYRPTPGPGRPEWGAR